MAENILNRLARNPYAPIDAASVTRIDEMGNGLDDWGNIIAQAPQQPQAQSWGELGYGIATTPMRFGNALAQSVNLYKGNEHPITQPDASSWQVPPLLSESWDALNSFGNAYHNGMSEGDMRRNANIAAGLTMGGGGLAARPMEMLAANASKEASVPALLSAGRAEAGTGTAEGLHLGVGSAWPNPQHAGQMADDLQGHIPAHQNAQGQASRSLIENDPYLKAWADHLGLDYDGLLSPAIAKAATDGRFEHYGIRATPYKMEAGTTPPNSTQWYQDFIDEEQSRATFPDHGEDLGGASTVGIEFTPEGVARARERIGSYWEPNELGNDFVSLLGSDKAWQGADIGENVLKDSVVLSQHLRSRYGETLFSNSDPRASLPALASGVGYDQEKPYPWPWR